jgi:beta-1,4-mannosyl-glycoprotein beta-1,4-N-acetylglucosaminyltransferase
VTRRPLIVDTFPIHDELLMLECRLEEIGNAVDYVIAVEADVTHQDKPKPYVLSDNLDRFARWKDKLVVVQATGLPTIDDDPDPWARELAQRGYVFDGLAQIPDLADDDIILHGDVDEIPTALHARNVRPQPGWFVSFGQRMHSFAVDWLHPDEWYGTTAARWATVRELGDNVNAFARMRDRRNRHLWEPGHPDGSWAFWKNNPEHVLHNAGWHLSWLGGQEAAFKKLRSFCHPEVADKIEEGLTADVFIREGWHVDGRKMKPVEVDHTWPKWIVDGNAPANWYRPR